MAPFVYRLSLKEYNPFYFNPEHPSQRHYFQTPHPHPSTQDPFLSNKFPPTKSSNQTAHQISTRTCSFPVDCRTRSMMNASICSMMGGIAGRLSI